MEGFASPPVTMDGIEAAQAFLETVDPEALEAAELALLHPVNTLEEAVPNFRQIKPTLSAVGLEHTGPFVEIYEDVSISVEQGVKEGRFNYPDDVRRTMPIFYNLFRQPFLAYLQGVPQVISPNWQLALYDKRIIHASDGMRFVAGMCAHINSDLAQALDMSGMHDDYKRDFTIIVGDILEEVAKKHAEAYIPVESPLLRQFALRGSLAYIAQARRRSWRDGKKLQKARQAEDYAKHAAIKDKIEQRALRHGKALAYGGGLLLDAAMQVDRLMPRSRLIDEEAA